MDINSLSSLFASGDWSLWDEGINEFNLRQKQAEANLASTLGAEQRAADKHPLTLENLTLGNRTAQLNNDNLQYEQQVRLPADMKRESLITQHRNSLDAASRDMLDKDMTVLSQLTAAAASNGGVLPLPLMAQVPERYRGYFADPKSVSKLAEITKAYVTASQKFLLENLDSSNKRLERAVSPPSRSGGGKSATNPDAPAKTRQAEIIRLRALLRGLDPKDPRAALLSNSLAQLEAEEKAFVNLRAEAAVAGRQEVVRMPDGTLTVVPVQAPKLTTPTATPVPAPSPAAPAPWKPPAGFEIRPK